MSDLWSFIMSNNHEFNSTLGWIRCCNDVMDNVDCVRKRDVHQQKMHSCSKNIHWISVFVLKVCVVYKKIYIIDVIAWLFR